MAKRNEGKKFEDDFKNSIPDHIWNYRIKDQPQFFDKYNKKNGNTETVKKETVRFTKKSECDYILFSGKSLICLELKSHLGVSLPFTVIKDHQIDFLDKSSKFKNVYSGFIINFRQYVLTFYLSISKFMKFREEDNKKSISIDDVGNLGGILIPCTKKISRYRYDLSYFFRSNN